MTEVPRDGRLPTEVVREIMRRTDGVPLFVEELTKMLLESDPAPHQLAAETLPVTLRDSRLARLDRPGSAKLLAQWGALRGREFWQDLLEAVAGLDPGAATPGLERLTGSGLRARAGRDDLQRPGGVRRGRRALRAGRHVSAELPPTPGRGLVLPAHAGLELRGERGLDRLARGGHRHAGVAGRRHRGALRLGIRLHVRIRRHAHARPTPGPERRLLVRGADHPGRALPTHRAGRGAARVLGGRGLAVGGPGTSMRSINWASAPPARSGPAKAAWRTATSPTSATP